MFPRLNNSNTHVHEYHTVTDVLLLFYGYGSEQRIMFGIQKIKGVCIVAYTPFY